LRLQLLGRHIPFCVAKADLFFEQAFTTSLPFKTCFIWAINYLVANMEWLANRMPLLFSLLTVEIAMRAQVLESQVSFYGFVCVDDILSTCGP
jgi:hypothetical protein